jgi:23S rRNA pseudouridine2605 synthase
VSAPREDVVLASFLARCGIASRRACERLITDGRVCVNGKVVTKLATRVRPGDDRISCDGVEIAESAKRYLLLHKPAGYVCSAKDRHADKLAGELIDSDAGERLFSIGRLDKDSEGLLLYTNDGELAQRLLHPRHEVEKEYHVTTLRPIPAKRLPRLLEGVEDEGDLLRAKAVEAIGDCELRIVVAEGKKREVRRMIRQLGGRVKSLRRVRFGPLELGDFQPGFSRDLRSEELAALRCAAGADA